MQKQYRLKKNEEIAKVVKKQQKARGYFYTVYYTSSDKVQIAISVSKKYGMAVERNKAKRIVREIVRSRIEDLNGLKLVIVVKHEAKGKDFASLNKDLNYQIDYILRRKPSEKN